MGEKKILTRRALRELAIEKLNEARAESSSGAMELALDKLVEAVDEAHTYPDSWGVAGKVAERLDAPLIRFLLHALLEQIDGD